VTREGLRHELPGAFRKAMQNFDPVIIRNIKVGTNGGTQFVDVTVQRIESPDSLRGMIMVVLTDMPAFVVQDTVNLKTGKRGSTGQQKEIAFELQRSYEDLQSPREEMQTVNVELQSKVRDFVQANDDMKNRLNSTEIATLFLDKELNIRRFTDPVTKIFKMRNAYSGRPFTDLVTDLQYPEIDSHARQVIRTLTSIESSITTNDGSWYNVRIMPYRTLDDRIDGVVITLSI